MDGANGAASSSKSHISPSSPEDGSKYEAMEFTWSRKDPASYKAVILKRQLLATGTKVATERR